MTKLIHIVTIVAFCLCSFWSRAAAAAQPNIVFILADDLGWADTTLNGHTKFYQTPNLERLAKRGVTFSRAYSASPLCSPTRSAILTGLSPARTGFTAPQGHEAEVRLQAEVEAKRASGSMTLPVSSVTRLKTDYRTLAEALRDGGYATGHFGKWHLGRKPYSPLEHGFDVDVPHFNGPGPKGFVGPWEYGEMKSEPADEHIEDRMAKEAVAFMTKHKERPFFLNYWMFSVHAPFDAKPALIEKHRARVDASNAQRSPTYAAMVESMDAAVGTLLDGLEKNGLLENTIIVFTSDNGGNMYNELDGTTPTSNAPLRGGKATLYEGGTRVPCVIAWPGVTKPGSRTDAVVQSEDYFPTLLDGLKLAPAADQRFDGRSILPALRGEAFERGPVFQFFPHSPGVPEWMPSAVSVHHGPWKLVRLFHAGKDGAHRYKLFNLAEDIGEQRDLASTDTARVQELDALIETFLRETKAVTPKPNPAFDPAKYDFAAEGVAKSKAKKKKKSESLRAEDGFRSLFNGKDLTGWDGNPALWSVEEGCITGKTQGPETLEYNQFLIWRGGEVKNFELRVKAKVTGNNTGIQFRSKELPEVGKWSIGGYQCDIHPAAKNNAMLYEERGRGIVALNGQSVVTDPAGVKWLVTERDPVQADVAAWHEYTVLAKGNHLTFQLDGKVTAELTDYDEAKRALSGLLAFQIHRGPAMNVQIKDVQLKELPDGGVLPFAKADIPNDAQAIEAKKPRAKPAAKPAAEKPAAKPRAKRPQEVSTDIGENKATPVERITTLAGFKAELLYSVPGSEQGSWVALCVDDKGRILASDQYGGLYRFAPPAAGSPLEAKNIEKLPLEIRGVNGMAFAFGALYLGVNQYEKKATNGVYRVADSNADGELDKVELLREFEGGSDHGVHAIVPTPDGKALYLITGNNAVIKDGPVKGTAATSPVAKLWGDDHLLPRMPDGRGHNRHVMAPGGIIYRFDPDGKSFEIFASGFRNIYDAGVNRDGELFTYDADMEYDFNMPWYRPTRINHVVSGGEYGWRNGAGKYPEFYADNLPATLNIGPGSPTGTTFGYGAKFPAKYQEAFYALDWSWGKIYAVHLTPSGSTYTATKEEFVTGGPLPVTDAVIGKDGAMYFAIGGRRVQSGLYRVSYTGSESTEPVPTERLRTLTTGEDVLHDLRRQLEALHGKQSPKAIETAWPHLSSDDRYLRAAARTVLEHQPLDQWQARALAESNATAQLEALLALARVTGVCPTHRAPGHTVNTAARDQLYAALLARDFAKLTNDQRLAYVRLVQIVLNRFGKPDDTTALIAKLDPAYPAANFELNWLLTETLAFLQAPNTAAKAMKLIATADSQEPQLEYARSIRFLKTGWTNELRTQQLEWFLKAANFKGGASFSIFVDFIRKDTLATFTDAEKTALAALIEKKPEIKSAIESAGAGFAGRTPTNWKLEDLSAAARDGMKDRNFDTGRKMFAAAACFACHRFGNAGGMTGPDLTGAGGRYSSHDLLDQILNPSKEINEQFTPIVVTRKDGTSVSGVVVNLNGDNVTLNTDLSDPNQRENVDRKNVTSIEPSKVSSMPPMLLAMLTKEEILDLLAYILSAGNPAHASFKK